MLKRIRQIFSGLAVREKFRKTESASEISPPALDADARFTGLKDMGSRGWYQVSKGYLFDGFKITSDDIVLDVGCGEGEPTLFSARRGAHVVFSDIDAQKVKILMEKVQQTKAKKAEGFVSDSLALPLPDNFATKIVSLEMLEHTSNPAKVLAELVRVGKPGAQYLITVPDARSEMLQKPFAAPAYFAEPNHIHIFDRESFVRLVEDSGLIIEKYDSSGFYWTVFTSLFWIIARHEKRQMTGAMMDEIIKPPYHPVLQNWSKAWSGLLELDGSEKLIESFNQYLPKTQIIIARKM